MHQKQGAMLLKNKKIYIYGASGHGLVVADIARACEYDEIIFIDDGENEFDNFESIQSNTGIPIALGVGDNRIRGMLFDIVEDAGFEIVTLVHPSSIISSSAIIGKGSVIMPNVVVNAKTCVGKGVILNTSCIIEHENNIANFVHISPNVTIAGNVRVGSSSHIGIGSNVIQGINIGESSVIGAGSTVVRDIKSFVLCFGTPCKIVKDIE